MEFLTSVQVVLSWVLPFLLVLTVLVFFHELGHYWAARRNGVRVDAFSIGFGPEIFGWNDSHGTRWKFSLIPFGGYVQMFGDANAASLPDFEKNLKLTSAEKKQTLDAKTVWQRIEVSGMGPLANIILGVLFLTVVFYVRGEQSTAPIFGEVRPGSVAAQAGIQPGDKVLSVNDAPVETFRQIQNIITKSPGTPLSFQIQRAGEQRIIPVVPESIQATPKVKIGMIGVMPELIPHSFFASPIAAVKSAVSMSWELLKFLGAAVSSKEDASKLGSVMSIAKVSKDSFEGGIISLLQFMALLSLNLGVINLIPVPGLDGGHLFFYIVEAIRGKPMSPKVHEISFKIGLGILGVFMLGTLWNDLIRFNVVENILNFCRKW
jgi:regulator of sigma E protease